MKAIMRELTAKEVGERETPKWIKPSIPVEFHPFLGKRGLPEPWHSRPGPLGQKTKGLDRWQANHFVVYRPETAKALYDGAPSPVVYRIGTLPAIEIWARRYAEGCEGPDEIAEAFATRFLPRHFPHPTVPPVGLPCPPDRALPDESLLATGSGFCNEQARIFVRLCQTQGIPARLIFLFYADGATGHTTAEYWNGRKWGMVDVSWYCVFRNPRGEPLSAAECHGTAEQREWVAGTYRRRMETFRALTDEEIAGRAFLPETPDRAYKVAQLAADRRVYLDQHMEMERLRRHLAYFGVLEMPLPPPARGRRKQ